MVCSPIVPAKGERRQQGGPAYFDVVAGFDQSVAGRQHVGPLLQQSGRNADRRVAVGRLRRERLRQNGRHVFAVAAHQHGQASLRRGQLRVEARQTGLHVPQSLAHQLELQRVGQSAVVARLGEPFALQQHGLQSHRR